jgi:hypothetical protein
MATALMRRDSDPANVGSMLLADPLRVHPITKVVASRLGDIAIDRDRAAAIHALLTAFVKQPANSDYPPLRMSTTDDDAVIIEWAFADRRLGFSYEHDGRESGWYFVRTNTESEHGPLASLKSNLPRLIQRCLQPA